jgi:aryl-alcohol dehydrogenase-like predicted oxidoreductase
VVGDALSGNVPHGVLVTTKVEVPEEAADQRRILDRLRASLDRLRIDRVDLFPCTPSWRPMTARPRRAR